MDLVKGALAALLALTACDGPPTSADSGPTPEGATARFTLGGDVLDFMAVPYPSDLYLDAEGRPRIGALPSRLSDDPRFVALRALLGAREGFCATCDTFFGIDGSLDPTSAPPSASPGDTASVTDAIVMMDAAGSAPIPLRVEADAVRGRVAVRPVRGIALEYGHLYLVALTDALRGADGTPLAASADFAALRDGTSDDARAREIIAPGLDTLEGAGMDRARIVALAAFTVGDPTVSLREARAIVHSAPAPVAALERTWSTTAELDDLLGVPAEDRAGIDVPALDAPDERAIGHTHVATVIGGHFTAPRIVEGEGSDVGVLRLDADGHLAAGPLEDVPFILTIPTGADVTHLPVVVHHHGFNASRVTGFAIAETAARAGYAVLSIDAYQHGERAAHHADSQHNVRGTAGADGLAETDTLEVSARVFGLEGVPDSMALFPGYPLAAFLQFAADAMAAVRFVREGDATVLGVAGLAFDADHVAYAGNSMGAVVGASVLSVETDVTAFVLNVQPGAIVECLMDGAEFRPVTEALFLPQLGVTGSYDEVTRSLVFEPTIDLFRAALEPIDPFALSPSLLRAPVVGGPRPDVLVQLASLDQLAAPTAGQSMMAAAGIPGIGVFELAEVAPAAPPLLANLVTPSGDVTAGAVRFDPAAHGMLELRAQTSTHEPPLVPPLVPRAMPVAVMSPIDAVHAQIERFLASRLTGPHAEIIAPGE